METGDAGGLAPGAPAAGNGLSALQRSPGTCLPDPAEQAKGASTSLEFAMKEPRLWKRERLRGPARMSEAMPENGKWRLPS